jgi:cytochrome c553
MKKVQSTIVAVIVALSFSSVVFAAGGPETIELPASMGKITFHHRQHQERLADCTKCHATAAGGKIEGFGKDVAHKTCKGCHSEMKMGPTSCKDCHKK